MIRYIKGIVTSVSEDAVIVEAGGIGYECLCGAADLGCFAAQIGKTATIYTYLSHKEDSMMLYGFSSEENRSGFLTLLKTDGIGPKMALKILSAYSMSQIQAYIEAEDLSALKKIPGLGAKTAGKLILDLKGKIVLPRAAAPMPAGIAGDIMSALINMGYPEESVRAVLDEHKPESDDFEKEFKRYMKLMRG
ncbi:MAG: Holliday junction branch migration protein RuvA [Spirochaetales bacterium]|nr:Holliday junction branch migration protein RuvA [Spirochaetales bacterium]